MSNQQNNQLHFSWFNIGTRCWLKPISLQKRQSNHQGRVITYVKRATRNYPAMFGNVANEDILIYCVLIFHNYYRSLRFIVPASSLLIWYRTILGNYNSLQNIHYSPRSSNCHSFCRFPKEINTLGRIINIWILKRQSFATLLISSSIWYQSWDIWIFKIP